MKVKIGPHTNWFGPYQLAEALCFWVKEVPGEYGFKSKPDWVHKFGEWLAYGSVEPEAEVGQVTTLGHERDPTLINKFLCWIYSKKKRTIEIQIDRWDTWNMDATLGMIALPMLKQLQKNKHGAPFVDDEDVPEELRSTSAPAKEDENDVDGNHFKRWDYVMEEMIFAFEHHLDDNWEDAYRSGELDLRWKKLEGGMSEMVSGPNYTYECDYDGIQLVKDRIQNGFRLFGKYYTGLWD
jgi:hypothetical protein